MALAWHDRNREILITDMSSAHIYDSLSYIDKRRHDLTKELAELNTKAKEMKRVLESREKKK